MFPLEPVLSSNNPQPNDLRDKSDAKRTHHKPKWVMTQTAFDKLLNGFSLDRDEAGRQYERTRTRLFRVFEWSAVGPADELADETFNRVARRIDEGQKIENLIAYIVGVAKIVCKEAQKKYLPVSLDDAPETRHRITPEPVEPDVRMQCFDHCLEGLTSERRFLIVEYYQQERRDKIDRRQKLAEHLGIPQNALRIRAHRIRMALENCITQCLEAASGRND